MQNQLYNTYKDICIKIRIIIIILMNTHLHGSALGMNSTVAR